MENADKLLPDSFSEIRDLLGHATIAMTEKYAHLAPENVRRAVARLDNRSRFGHVVDSGTKKAVNADTLTA